MKQKLIAIGVAALVGIGAAFLIWHNWERGIEREVARRYAELLANLPAPDTTYIRDTVYFEGPQPAAKIVKRVDTVYVKTPGQPVPVPVTLERVQRIYRESGFDAWVTGSMIPGREDTAPALDSVHVFTEIQIVEKPVPVAAPTAPRRPLRIGVEGFATLTPNAANSAAYGPAGYVKYKGERLELKVWGGYNFGKDRGATFGGTASFDLFKF